MAAGGAGAGAGASTGAGVGGSPTAGGGGAPCEDIVATEPMPVAQGLTALRPVISARSDGTFGLAWEAGGQLFTAIVAADGSMPLSPTPLGAVSAWGEGAIASHDDEHVVLRFDSQIVVERVDGEGQISSIPTGIVASLHDVVAGGTGYLLTFAETGNLARATLGFGNSTLSASQLFPDGGLLYCCGGRRWKVGALASGGFAALWRASSNKNGLDSLRLTAEGAAVPGTHGFVDVTTVHPEVASAHGDGALFSSDGELVVIGEDGGLMATASFELGVGSASSTGLVVRGAYGTGNGIDWYDMSIDGGGSTLRLRMEPGITSVDGVPSSATAPRVASDGEGFGVVWLAPPQDVTFAYLVPCTD